MTNLNFSKDFNNFFQTLQSIEDNKIIIYGNGTIGKTIQALIPDKIVGFVDIADKNNHPKNLLNMKYDKILISVLGREEQIIKYLIEDLKINIEKIVTFNINNNSIKDDTIPKTDIKLKYKNFSIFLPYYNDIPRCKKLFKKYDRFLPFLATYIKNNETIVDIGANVGDSLAGMIEENENCSYLCIEADEYFFDFLCKNIEIIKNEIKSTKIFLNNSLVGKNITNVSLEGTRGTKHAVIDSGGKIQSKPLDEIISMYPGIDNIRLIKSDVDGFDYDVINSSLEIIQKYKPLIFFECQYDFEWQLNGYFETLIKLNGEGYDKWLLLDNFGDIMLQTNDMNTINQLLKYIYRQNIDQSTRTIYYFDILAIHKDDKLDINDLVSKFLSKFNKGN